jgi:two-component sensor histidine kinase
MRDVTQARERQEQLLRRNRQLAALTTLAEVANSSLNIGEIARNTLEVAIESTGMEGGAIHLADATRTHLQLYVHKGLPAELVQDLERLRWGEGVSGTVAASGQPRIHSDLTIEAPEARPAAIRHGFKSVIIVPVKAKGELIGTLGLISKQDVAFTAAAIEMVTAMGNQLGIALANARLYEAQLRENEKLNALLEISSGTTQQLEWKSLIQRILRKASQLLKADGAYMVRYDAVADEAEVVAVTSAFEELIGTRFSASLGLFGQIRTVRQGRIFTQEEVAQHGYSPILRQSDARSVLLVPLVSRNELIGALGLTRRSNAESDFTRENLELMEAFASRAAVAIDNAQLLEDLQQKNELLQLLIEESHHRIKNNLQMISGLLQLQAESAQGDSAWTEHLHTAMSRIQAIAQVHNLLSQEMPENVDAQVLITAIVDTLVTSGAGNGPPSVTTQLDHVWLNSEQAVALALIVNELLANALLHGHPPDGEPLRLGLRCLQREHEVCLRVCDNGGGIPNDRKWQESEGQGMNIVAQLARVNLRGALDITNRDGGLCAELRFAIAGPHAAVPRTPRLAEAGT